MVKTNMSSNGPSLGPDPNSDSRKLSCRSETAVGGGVAEITQHFKHKMADQNLLLALLVRY